MRVTMDDLLPLLARHGLLIVFAAVLLARAGAPVPGGPVLVVAGALAAQGRLPMAAVVALSLVANVLGDAVWFVGGRRHGYRVMRLLCRISLSPDTCVRQSEGLFTRWGGVSLVAAKFVPGVSVIAAPMAGALQMSWRRFVAWDLAGGLAWTALYLGAGIVFRTQVQDVLAILADAGTKAAIGLALLAAVVLGGRWLQRRAARLGRSADLIGPEALHDMMAAGPGPTILDMRGALARQAAGMVPGALAAELADLPRLAAQLRPGEVVVYCNCPNEVTALKAAALLRKLGVPGVRVLVGGYDGWQAMQAERETAAQSVAQPA
jgi:membrane protein DedA with SNARE-associated domain/rhodanese-related sulfurtransferase